MATNEILCVGPVSGSLCLEQSPWQTETLLLSQLGVIWVPFHSGISAVGWGALFGIYTPYFSGGTPSPLKYPSGTSAATCGSPASPLTPPLHSLPVLLW